MDYKSLNYFIDKQARSNYFIIRAIVEQMTDEEYKAIPTIDISSQQREALIMVGIWDIPSREQEKFFSGCVYFDLFYSGTNLYKVKNQISKMTSSPPVTPEDIETALSGTHGLKEEQQ